MLGAFCLVVSTPVSWREGRVESKVGVRLESGEDVRGPATVDLTSACASQLTNAIAKLLRSLNQASIKS